MTPTQREEVRDLLKSAVEIILLAQSILRKQEDEA